MNKLYNVQVLRGIAALMVALSHLGYAMPVLKDWHLSVLEHGASGVDIFFVISGFIMVYTTEGRATGPVRFMRSRVVRIVPLYWLLTFAVFLAALVLPRFFPQVSADMPHLAASLFFLPQEKSPIVYVGWTLNFEMLFYVLFAVGLSIGRVWRVLFPLLFITIAAVLGTALGSGPQSGIWWSFLTDPMSLEFCGGMVIGWFWERFRPDARIAWLALGLAFVALLAGPFPLNRPDHWLRVVAWGMPAFVIVAVAIALEVHGHAWRNAFLQELGNASYSVYLTHVFIVRAFEKFPVTRFLGDGPAVAIIGSVVACAVVLGVGIGVHHLVEKPFSALFDKLLPKPAAAQRVAVVG